MLGIFNRRMNSAGAIAGMLSGLSFTLIYVFIYKGWLFIPGTNMLPDSPEYWLMGIGPQSIGAVGAIINVVIATLVSRATAPPPADIQELVESIRVPRAS